MPTDADGGDQPVGGDFLHLSVLHLDMGGDRVGALVDLGHLGLEDDLHALLLELLLGEFRDLDVLDRHDLRHQFHHGDLDAHRPVERRELDADRAGAHDQQRLRHLRRHHRLEIGPDQLAVRLDAGQHARPRAGGDDDVLGLVGALAQRVLRQRRLRLHRLLGGLATTISPGLVSFASPQITSTLFFFIRKPTPPFMRPAMPRERSTMAFRSGVILPSSFRP